MKSQNHFSKYNFTSSPLKVVFLCLRPWREAYLPFLSLFRNLSAGTAPCLQGLSLIYSFRRERKCHDSSLPENSCPAGNWWCSFASCLPVCTVLALVWLQRLHLGPHRVHPVSTLIWFDDPWKPNKLSESIGPTKTRQNKAQQESRHPEWSGYIKSSSDLFGALNSCRPQGVNELATELLATSGLRVKTEKKVTWMVGDIRGPLFHSNRHRFAESL